MDIDTVAKVVTIGAAIVAIVAGLGGGGLWAWGVWNRRQVSVLTEFQRDILQDFEHLGGVAAPPPAGGYTTINWKDRNGYARTNAAADIVRELKRFEELGLVKIEGGRRVLTRKGKRWKALVA